MPADGRLPNKIQPAALEIFKVEGQRLLHFIDGGTESMNSEAIDP